MRTAPPGVVGAAGETLRAVLVEVALAVRGDRVALLAVLFVDGRVPQLLEQGERGVDHARARAVAAGEAFLNGLDDLVAVARALGDQREDLELASRE